MLLNSHGNRPADQIDENPTLRLLRRKEEENKRNKKLEKQIGKSLNEIGLKVRKLGTFENCDHCTCYT